DLAYHLRCIQSVDLVPKPTHVEKPGVGHHVLESKIGQTRQLQQFGQGKIDAQLAFSGRFTPDAYGVTFQPARFAESGTQDPKVRVKRVRSGGAPFWIVL